MLLRWDVGAARRCARLAIIALSNAERHRGGGAVRRSGCWERRLGTAGGPATRGLSAGERFVHDAADSPGASPTLGAAAKAVIDFAGSARRSLVTGKSRPDVVVSEHVAGADDHRTKVRRC